MWTLHEAFEYPFTRLDPVRGDHVDPPSVAIFETLLRKGRDGQPLPGLAESWTIQDGGRTWLLRLRAGARFHSGAPCDAGAVVRALQRCRWGEGLARQVWYWDPVDQVACHDERTVAITLHRPCLRLPVLIWGTHTAIANPDLWLELGDEFGIRSADGTGPYRLISYSPQDVIAQRAIPGSGPDRIHWHSIPDDQQRQACLAEQRFDIVRYVNPDGIDSSRPSTDWTSHQRHEDSQFYLALNFDDPRGFRDVQVRRCFDGLIDREHVLANALDGRGDARRSPIPIADDFATDDDPVDTGRASVPAWTQQRSCACLAELGWRADSDGILSRAGQRMSLECVIQDTVVGRAIGVEVARQLRSWGIELRLQPVPLFEPFYRAVADGPAAFISKWLWPDAMEAIMGFSRADCIEPGGGNWQAARCPQVDACFDDFLYADSPEALRVASVTAQRTFMEHLPYLPLVSPIESMAVRSPVRGFELTPGTLYPPYGDVTAHRGAA